MDSNLAGHIWLVDESGSLNAALSRVLEDGYHFETFSSIRAVDGALDCVGTERTRPPLLVIRDGFRTNAVLDFLMERAKSLPRFMIVTPCNDLNTISSCLELGTEDYFLEPVDENLIAAKVKYILEGERERRGPLLLGLELDVLTLSAGNRKGLCQRFTVREFQILSVLHNVYPAMIDRGKLMKEVWGNQKVVPKNLDVHLFHVRKKLEALGFDVLCRWDGYRLLRKRFSR